MKGHLTLFEGSDDRQVQLRAFLSTPISALVPIFAIAFPIVPVLGAYPAFVLVAPMGTVHARMVCWCWSRSWRGRRRRSWRGRHRRIWRWRRRRSWRGRRRRRWRQDARVAGIAPSTPKKARNWTCRSSARSESVRYPFTLLPNLPFSSELTSFRERIKLPAFRDAKMMYCVQF